MSLRHRLSRRWCAAASAIVLVLSGGLLVTAAGPASAAATFPLKISGNARYLVDANNQPFFLAADTSWFALEMLTDAEVETYLDNRAAKGFNTVMVMAPHHWTERNRYGQLPFTTAGNLSTPDPGWWGHMDSFVDKARARGMAVTMALTWLGFRNEEWGAGQLASNSISAAAGFGQFIGRRYATGARTNVFFQLGGDANPTTATRDRINAIANGIRAINGTVPITAHGQPSSEARVVYSSNAPWLNLNSVYTYYPGKNGSRFVYAMSEDAYTRGPAMPFVMLESGYENDGASLALVRASQYWGPLSGSTGFAYGHRSIWPFNDSVYGSGAWQDRLNDRGGVSAGLTARVFQSRPWWNLVPDFTHTTVTAGYGTFNDTNSTSRGGLDYVTTARTGDGTLVMSYLPSTGTGTRTLTVDMTRLSGTATAKWFNPANGAYTTIGTFANTGSRTFTTPGNNGQSMNDWLLILEAAGPPSTTYSTFTSLSSTLRLAVAGGTDNVVQIAPATSSLQQWEVRANGSYVNLVNRSTGQCAMVNGSALTNSATIVQTACSTTTTSQQWTLSGGQIVNRNSGKCLDVPGRSTTNGIQLIQYTCSTTGATNQQWTRA